MAATFSAGRPGRPLLQPFARVADGALKAHAGGFQLPISFVHVYMYIYTYIRTYSFLFRCVPANSAFKTILQCVQNFNVCIYIPTCIYPVSRFVSIPAKRINASRRSRCLVHRHAQIYRFTFAQSLIMRKSLGAEKIQALR